MHHGCPHAFQIFFTFTILTPLCYTMLNPPNRVYPLLTFPCVTQRESNTHVTPRVLLLTRVCMTLPYSAQFPHKIEKGSFTQTLAIPNSQVQSKSKFTLRDFVQHAACLTVHTETRRWACTRIAPKRKP